jgi:phage protein D
VTERRNFDTLTPAFRLRINGAELPLKAQADVISVSVLDDVSATGMCSFSLLCWDGAEMRVKWIDDDLFKEGNSVEIEMGYRDRLERLFHGEITGLEPEFPNEQPPTLTVRGYDRRHRLMGRRKTRTFLRMKDSAIANQIAADWSLTPEIEDTRVVLDYILQHNQTDFAFLHERAQRIGYEVVVTDRTLRFRPHQNSGSATLTLNREVELLDFYVRLSTIGQVEEVFVQGWNPKKKEEFVARSGTGDERPMAGSASGPVTAQRAFGGTGATTVNTPVQSQSEADQMANGWFGENALYYVVGHGVCIGRPDLKAGLLVEIEGLGRRFSGPYYVTSTEHRFKSNSGYRTAFTVRRNAT